MTDVAERTSTQDPVADVQAWLQENWDPDLTVGEWWERLGSAGWSAPAWPAEWYGRGLARDDTVRVQNAIAAHGALAAPGGLGLLLAGPTIAVHGTDEQKRRFLRDIVTGQKAWCQLFSEPGAGSDLAGLQTRAERDGEEWVVNGQKVWTSGGQHADLAMLIARTNPDAPKHKGISYLVMDMHQPGVEVRPLRELTGRALFNEVFLSDARVPVDATIGDEGEGWKVANTTLMFERAGLGSGGGSGAASAAIPGTVAGHLERRAGDFVRGGKDADGGEHSEGAVSMLSGAGALLREIARASGASTDPTVRQDLVRLHTLGEVGRYNNMRLKAALQAGQDIAGLPNIAKLSMSEILRQTRDLGLRLLGPYGTLFAYDRESRAALEAATGRPLDAVVGEVALFAQGPSIYGGTDQIQRNILGERVLGLPREPGPDRDTPFRELPKNG